jgi:hypothetical protein
VAAKIANLDEGRPDKTASIEAVSLDDAAQLLNVSRSGVQRAKKVLDDGTLILVSKVESGEVLRESELSKGGRPTKNQLLEVTGFPTLEELGISPSTLFGAVWKGVFLSSVLFLASTQRPLLAPHGSPVCRVSRRRGL